MRTFSAKDLLLGLGVLIGFIAVALIYGYIVWHSYNKPTFLSEKSNCQGINASPPTTRGDLFGYRCE